MLARRLLIPVVFVALIFAYLTWSVDDAWAIWMVPPLVVAAALLTLGPQIELWHRRRNPKDLPEPIQKLFAKAYGSWYTEMPADERRRFNERVDYLVLALSWRGQGIDEIPPDVEAAICSQLARLTLGQHEPFIKGYEEVVLYRHAFPTPAIPRPWHASELFHEDGVVIFSLEQGLPGMYQPRRYFNIVLYEWVRAMKASKGDLQVDQETDWHTVVREVAGHSPEWVTSWIGLPVVDGEAVVEVIRREWPKEYDRWQISKSSGTAPIE